MKAKQKNVYKKLVWMILIALVAGGVLGFAGALAAAIFGGAGAEGLALLARRAQSIMLPGMAVITAASVLYGEWNLRKLGEICKNLMNSEDEECDRWEYEEERMGARGTLANVLSQILCILLLSSGYSLKYITAETAGSFLVVCALFIVCFIYDGFWQVRYVKLEQKAHPEKQGDPTSLKFQDQWLMSCDEAEREVIYRSAYASYRRTGKCIPVLLFVTMISHLFLDTGVMAILVVAFVWLVNTVSYLRSAVKLKGARL